MSILPVFKKNTAITMGVELELQLVNLQDFNLAMEAEDFLRRILEAAHTGEIKPEITQAMIEINSSVHRTYLSLLKELCVLRNFLTHEATQTHIGICGGGAHPFQQWKHQRIFPTKRFSSLSEQYGYLANQFTVFGQHIHIACENGDDAIYLCHAMARFMPHFIALSAASPFHEGVDTTFDSSRLAAVGAFPLSGTLPWRLNWSDFESYFDKMYKLGAVKSMKDFYWDIRPKPEYGTVEIRICDTPLTVHKAADLAAYAQMIAKWLLDEHAPLSPDIYLTYKINRFRGARYGLGAIIIDLEKEQDIPLADDILKTCDKLKSYAAMFESEEALENIRITASQKQNDATWMRKNYTPSRSLNDIVKIQTDVWMYG